MKKRRSKDFAPEKLKYNTNEGKGKDKKKERLRRKGKKKKKKKNNGALLVLIMGTLETVFGQKKKLFDGRGPFGSNVFKNPARYIKLHL